MQREDLERQSAAMCLGGRKRDSWLGSDDSDDSDFEDAWMRSDDEDSTDEDERPRRQYSAPRDWNRMEWERRVAFLKPHEFKRFYRFDYKLFKTVVTKLRPILQKHSPSAIKLRGSPISAWIQLACTLRYLAGGSYLDIAHHHGVSDTNFNKIVDRVVGALLQVYGAEHLGIDKFGDEVWLSKTSATFGECTCSGGCSALTPANHSRVH